MEKQFWHDRWRNGQIGFHSDKPHWALEQYWQTLNLSDSEPVLVPLCGKSVDMHWLRQRGHPVDGVEIDPLAVAAFFLEWQEASAKPIKTLRSGACIEGDGIRLWNMDFLAYQPSTPGRAFYDRAALIALPPPMRPSYLEHLRSCLETGALGLLVSLEYSQDQMDGPPFSVSLEEIDASNAFSIEATARRDVLADSPKFRDKGVSWLHEVVYRLKAV